MLVTCWSVKGGSGTTVVAASLALRSSHLAPHGALLVDLAGDIPSVLGVAEPPGPGVTNFLETTHTVRTDVIDALSVRVTDHLQVLHRGDGRGGASARWGELAATLSSRPGVVVVDAGTGHVPQELLDASDENLMVLRPCYLAVRRASMWPVRPTGIVLVRDPGHALTNDDVERAVGVPVRAEVEVHPAVSRAVDAGLLAGRLPALLTRGLRGAA